MTNQPMRVTHLAIIHPALDTRIFQKECRGLAAAGYDVHLVVGAPPAPELDGVTLHRCADTPGRPPARRQPRRFLRVARWALRLRRSTSLFHIHEPHLIPLALALKLAGSRVVYDVHEDYPGHARSKLVGRPVRARVKAVTWACLEWLAARALDGFVCASPAIAESFPAERTAVVRNFPLRAPFAAAEANGARPYRERPNEILYTGVIRDIRGFWEIARALELLPPDLDCRLRLIGHWRPPELEHAARRRAAWGRIEFVPWQPYPEVVRQHYNVRAGVILLHPLPNHDDPIRSNKLFEYMGAGLPVIASDLAPWREIVCGVGCGLVADPHDPEAIAAAIGRLLRAPEEAEAMGERGRAAVWSDLNWDGEERRLLSLYRELVGELPAPAP